MAKRVVWAGILSVAMLLQSTGAAGISVHAAERTGSMVTDGDLEEDSNAEPPEDWGVTPNEEQLHYMKSGLSAFCHFGPNTYNNVEWGENYGTREPEDIFRLEQKFDAENIVKAVKEAGFSRILLTAKHHDGFGLWDSALTDYDIGSTPYGADGGDILEELSDACTKYNLDMGCYLSPWDIHEDRYGCFGDNNNGQNVTGITDYNELYIGEIREICTAKKEDGTYKYGNNHPDRRSDRFVEWWMDGAQGSSSNRQTYDWKGILGEITEHNPSCQVIGTGKAVNGKNGEEDVALASTGGIHWIGNESGLAADETWAKVRIGEDYEFLPKDGGYIGLPEGDQWSVPEADTKILNGWFWTDSAPDRTVKSESQLADIYFRTVGRGATLLLNLSPNKEGKVGEEQMERFVEFGENIKETFDEDLAKAEGVTVSASSVWKNAKAFSPANVIDEIPEGAVYDDTYWAPAEGETTGTLEIDLGGLRTFDVVSIEEYIQKGQSIASFSVEYKDVTGSWEPFGEGKTISSKRLCRRAPVEGTAVRIQIRSAYATPMINNVGVFKAAEGFEVEEEGVKLPSNLESIPITEFTLDESWKKENNNTSAWSNAAKKGEASFTFTGTQAWIMGTKDTGHGTMDIYIDGQKVGSADTKADKRATNQLLYTTPELSYGVHTVRIVCTKDAIGLNGAQYADGSGIFEMNMAECGLLYGGTAELEIVRTAGARGEATVFYGTQSAGAEQGVNYVHLSDSVTFRDGETSKKILLTGLENDRSEDGKDFYFTLMKGDGISIGNVSSTHVTCYNINVETIYNDCKSVVSGDYQKAGREAFQEALAELEAYMNSEAATESAKREAAKVAFQAKNNLVRRDGYTEQDPYELPKELNQENKIEAEDFLLDASGAVNQEQYVRIAKKNYGTVIDFFEEGNKIRLPFYAAKAGVYKVSASYRSGRGESSNRPNALNWSGANVEEGSLAVYGELNATTDHIAECMVRVLSAGDGELVFTADERGGPVLDWFQIQYVEASLEPVAVTGVTLNKSEVTIQAGTWCEVLLASVEPVYASNQNVTFQSSDPDVAAVDAHGVVKGLRDGTATITVTTEDGSHTATCSVTVTAEQEEARENLSQAAVKAEAYVKEVQEGKKQYTKESWDAFLKKYQNALEKAEDAAAGAEELKQAERELTEAIQGLMILAPSGPLEGDDKPGGSSPVALNAPLQVAAVSTETGVKITFEKVEHAASYEIYRQIGSQAPSKIAVVTEPSYVDEKAVGGVKISYTVVAVSSSAGYVNSAASAAAEVTLPKAVSKLKVKAKKGGVEIRFKKVKGAKNYIIYRSNKKNGVYKKIKTLSAKKTVFVDKKAKKGKNFYKVVTKAGNVYSPASGIKSAKVKKASK